MWRVAPSRRCHFFRLLLFYNIIKCTWIIIFRQETFATHYSKNSQFLKLQCNAPLIIRRLIYRSMKNQFIGTLRTTALTHYTIFSLNFVHCLSKNKKLKMLIGVLESTSRSQECLRMQTADGLLHSYHIFTFSLFNF